MTVNKIETVKELIDEMNYGRDCGSAWEYINTMNNQKMFAVFPASQTCDIFDSPYVKEPKQIWSQETGFMGDYEYLNDES